MIQALFFREWKSHYKLFLLFCAVITLYSSMIIAMFDPKLGESLHMMAESMPELFAAFGMMNVGATLLEFIANYLYGFILVVFPVIFLLMLSNKLIAAYVDQGAMAYLLAAPHKRRDIVLTQAAVLVSATILLLGYTTLLGIGVSQAMFPGELKIGTYFLLNVGLLGFLIFMGGICFFASCLFSDTKYSYGMGAGCAIAFILIQMVSQVGEKFEKLKYLTPLTLFDVDGLVAGKGQALASCLILYAAGFGFLAAGVLVFQKKDLAV